MLRNDLNSRGEDEAAPLVPRALNHKTMTRPRTTRLKAQTRDPVILSTGIDYK